MNVSNVDGPVKTLKPVVVRTTSDGVSIDDAESGVQDIIVTSSARDAAYAKSGWTQQCFGVDHPWVSDDAKLDTTSAPAVTGRYLLSQCTIALTDEARPHPEFEDAVQRALTVENAAKRSEELGNVFRAYGHVYIVSVELGGMRHATLRKQAQEQVRPLMTKFRVKLLLMHTFAL